MTIAMQGRDWEAVIDLTTTGLTYEDVTVKYRKYGGTLTTWVIEEEHWSELGDGLYALTFPGAFLDTIGEFWFEALEAPYPPGGPIIRQTLSVWPAPAYSAQPGTCVVSGQVADLAGEVPCKTVTISFQLAEAPQTSNDALVAGRILRTIPDAYGNFSVALIRGVKVLVQIESVGIRHVITVPDQESANILDLLPPIPSVP